VDEVFGKRKDLRAQIVTLPKSDPDVIYIGLNNRDKARHDLYALRISTARKNAGARKHRAHQGFRKQHGVVHGDRYEEGATPEVAARLAEITVDPKNVVLENDQNHQKSR
jgi:hypothetical protein